MPEQPDDHKLDDLAVFSGGAAANLPTHEPATEPSPASDIEGLPPELIDHPRYQVVRLLGRGGMGAVFQAQHRLMDRPVALKVIHRDWTANRSASERFLREVKSAARLHHPNIVTAFDAD